MLKSTLYLSSKNSYRAQWWGKIIGDHHWCIDAIFPLFHCCSTQKQLRSLFVKSLHIKLIESVFVSAFFRRFKKGSNYMEKFHLKSVCLCDGTRLYVFVWKGSSVGHGCCLETRPERERVGWTITLIVLVNGGTCVGYCHLTSSASEVSLKNRRFVCLFIAVVSILKVNRILWLIILILFECRANWANQKHHNAFQAFVEKEECKGPHT